MIGGVTACTFEKSPRLLCQRLGFFCSILFSRFRCHVILQSLQKSMAHCLPAGADRGSRPCLQISRTLFRGNRCHASTAASLVLQTDQLGTLDGHYAFLSSSRIDHLVRILFPIGTRQRQRRLVPAAHFLLSVLETSIFLWRKTVGHPSVWKCTLLAGIGCLYHCLCPDQRRRRK